MAVKFVIDSASDVLPEEAKALGVYHCPLKVLFGEEEYADAVDMTHKEFYEKLTAEDVLPTTSQVPPADFMAAFEEITEAGDVAIAITISSKLSGTYQSAMVAADGYEGKVFVIDSRTVTAGERILLMRGLELAKQGLAAEEIVAQLEEEKDRVRLVALVDTLEYLKKGGRVSPAVAFAGGLLSIKPVIAVEDGVVVMAGKARGAKQGNNLLRELASNGGGIDFERPVCLAYSGLSDDAVKKFKEENAEFWQGHENEISIASVGCVIGTHAGPGAVAVVYFEK